MNKDNLNIENLFKESFDSYQVTPKAKTWANISRKMFIRKFTTFSLTSFNVYYLAAVILTVSCVAVFLNSGTELYEANRITKIETKLPSDLKKVPEDKVQETKEPQKITEKRHISKKVSVSNNDEQKATDDKNNKIETIETVPSNHTNSIDLDKPDKQSDLEKLKSTPPEPLFEIDKREGCAPFEVKIKNFTKYARDYEWSFGNGEKSSQENPVFTYHKPGVYTIMLKAKGAGGTVVSVVDSIIVHDRLIYETEHSFIKQICENEGITVKLKGRKGVRYKWYFGDGITSEQQQDTHSYSKAGVYPIVVTATSKENCQDSVLITNVKVIKSPNRIVFPNAFCPNISGPSSGKYVKNTLHNEIFYPVVVGTLSEYHIKIYAKTGVVLFETTDVKTGWNGYYDNKLIPEGVYPYVVVARFEGDTKTIQKRGNVTVLHKSQH